MRLSLKRLVSGERKYGRVHIHYSSRNRFLEGTMYDAIAILLACVFVLWVLDYTPPTV